MPKIESYKTNTRFSKKKKLSLRSLSKKLRNKREIFKGKTIEDTNKDLQQIEEKIKTQEEKKDIEKLKKTVTKGNSTNKNGKTSKKTQKKELEEIRNEAGLTITDFDDSFDDIADDFDDMKRRFPLLTLQSIVQKIKQNRLKRQKYYSNNKNKRKLLTKKNNLTPLEERKEAVSDIIFDSLDTDDSVGDTNLTENIETIAYIIQNFDKFDDEKKKKFMKRFQEILAHYMEGKIIEVYEITIKDGKIIVTGKGEDGKPMTITLDEKKIGKKAMQKIKKMLKNKKKTLFTKNKSENKIFKKIEIGKRKS